MSAVIYPTTNLMATEQLVIDRGEGVYVYDNRGKQYLEGMGGCGVPDWVTATGS
jgi:4-aminobutyrate---pyruvate transaminase